MSVAVRQETPPLLDVDSLRRDFPVFERDFDGQPVAFLDTAASAQKPRQVIDAMAEAMGRHYANIHRGVYRLSQESTEAYEAARERVARFLNARSAEEIVFTRNATEAINLVAASWGGAALSSEDEVVLTELEHHANIVPWQLLQQRLGFALKIIPVQEDGSIRVEDAAEQITARTKLVSISAMSNVLGTLPPVAAITRLAHDVGALVLLDGCQSAIHSVTDVQALDCDFFVFSGHKLYGPSGIGVLWARSEILAAMPPYQGGGDMIDAVSFAGTTFAEPPARFEAGTPAIVEAIGLHAAIDYVDAIGLPAIAAHEAALLSYATDRLRNVAGLRLYGTAPEKASVISFLMDSAHAHDVATILDKKGIAVRAGHHCAQPLMDRYGIAGTTRASMALYVTQSDIDRLVDGLHLVNDLFG